MKLTDKQKEAKKVCSGGATHIMLFGGSRSGKTFILVRNLVTRALKAPKSRHAILRFRFNHVKNSIVLDTFPKVMQLCFPDVAYTIDKTDWYVTLPGGSEIWFGGLDDKERTEKILGQEYATIYLNECSQIPYSSRNLAVTRLAQLVEYNWFGKRKVLEPKMYYDCNPPGKGHWTYKLFIKGVDPLSKEGIKNHKSNYSSFQMNPEDNLHNLPKDYIDTLKELPKRLQVRFLKGLFADDNPNSLWSSEVLERYRVTSGDLPDIQRKIIAIDPSGADDVENAENDEIGICVMGLGTDGNGYLLEDLTMKGGPAKWGAVATTAFDRHDADLIVAEDNYGGAMVKFVVQTQKPGVPYKSVKATRGKVVRAEPVSALYEKGKIRHVGYFHDLEDELCNFSTVGYLGEKSPNRGDAVVWAATELFPALTPIPKKKEWSKAININTTHVV